PGWTRLRQLLQLARASHLQKLRHCRSGSRLSTEHSIMQTTIPGGAHLQPEQTALLVIDLQNDFCSPEGYLAKRRGYKVSFVNDLLPNIRRLLELARAQNMSVVWVRSHYDFKYINEVFQDKRGEEGCCVEGTWGA